MRPAVLVALSVLGLAALPVDSAIVTKTFTATSDVIPNPDRGFYGYGGDDFGTAVDIGNLQANFAAGDRLVLATVKLNNYRTTVLPDSLLATLNANFAQVRDHGMKTTLLFSYDQSAGGQDATASRIEAHLQQLRPVLRANADVIPYMRAGFIGAWGEWHSSKNGNSCGFNSGTTPCSVADANRKTVRNALLNNVAPTTQIAFRLPADLIKWYPDPTTNPRAGMHNDCFLASPDDFGTYASEDERTYIKQRTVTASFGGETCVPPGTAGSRDTCTDILAEGAQYHLAWLNKDYHPDLVAKWQADGCYDTILKQMGYRVVLDYVNVTSTIAIGTTSTVKVGLHNEGWARVFGTRRLVVVIKHRATGAVIQAGRAVAQLNRLPPQATAATIQAIDIRVPLGSQLGVYDVYLAAPDPFPNTKSDPRFSLRFANADTATQGWDETMGSFKTGATLSAA